MLAFAFFANPARAADLPKGTVIVARTAPTALLVWDASAAVGDLVIAQQTGAAGMRALERDGIAILSDRASRLRAPRVELHVQYAPSGIVGAAYQASTFANATPLMILTAQRSAIPSSAKSWLDAVDAGRTPAGLIVKTTGTFPQSQ